MVVKSDVLRNYEYTHPLPVPPWPCHRESFLQHFVDLRSSCNLPRNCSSSVFLPVSQLLSPEINTLGKAVSTFSASATPNEHPLTFPLYFTDQKEQSLTEFLDQKTVTEEELMKSETIPSKVGGLVVKLNGSSKKCKKVI